jgi:hypothetical protein
MPPGTKGLAIIAAFSSAFYIVVGAANAANFPAAIIQSYQSMYSLRSSFFLLTTTTTSLCLFAVSVTVTATVSVTIIVTLTILFD